jgi:hypothetical protein
MMWKYSALIRTRLQDFRVTIDAPDINVALILLKEKYGENSIVANEVIRV